MLEQLDILQMLCNEIKNILSDENENIIYISVPSYRK